MRKLYSTHSSFSKTEISCLEFELNNPTLEMTLGNWVLGRAASTIQLRGP